MYIRGRDANGVCVRACVSVCVRACRCVYGVPREFARFAKVSIVPQVITQNAPGHLT
jgi:hypothetical protein